MDPHCIGKEKVPVHLESTEKNILTSDSARLGPQSEREKNLISDYGSRASDPRQHFYP